MGNDEVELEVDLATTATAQGLIALLESTIAGLKKCTHRFRVELTIKDLGK